MFDPKPGNLKDDVASASSAYLVNALPELLTLPKSELFDALRRHFLATLTAYERERRRKSRLPTPSVN